MSKTYDLLCYLCEKSFKTYRALCKHKDVRHTKETFDERKIKFVDRDSSEVCVPLLKQLDAASSEYSGYLLWLAGVAEQINASLHPDFPGGWFKIDLLQVPSVYFEHFVFRLDCKVDSIRCVSHKRPPTYSKSTKRISYKQYDQEKLIDCLHEQTMVTIKRSVVFSGTREINRPAMTIQEEIEAAAQRDPWSSSWSKNTERATLHADLQVGVGQGRYTREVEVIWWPDVFQITKNGHLTLRFYLQKVSL